MNMKNLYRILSCALLLLAATTSALAENGIKETRNYTICPGDTMRLSTRSVVVYKPTTLYDTLLVASPTEDSIIAYVVNLYPHFEKDEYKRLQKGATYDWQDTTIADPGVYVRIYHSQEGCDSIYRLHVTQPIDSAITFTLCDDESITFNGRTYSNAGVYEDILSGDTVYTITIIKHPSREYLQYGVLDRTHPYYWQYTLDGELKTDTIYEPGRYIYTSQNPETGCNDRWILVLTKDETSFHSIETVTICESETFNWRNHMGLNRLGVGQTIHYYDRYRTAADQDSIYELILTVKPVLRSTRTIPFCGSIEWNGKTYTESQTIVDSLTSVQFSCDSIVTTILVKGTPVTRHDTISILGGEVLSWHGQTITTAGDYTDVRHSLYGCDTTFYLNVTLKEPAHVMNTHSEWYSICQGDGQPWRGETYYNSGIYYDTIKTAGGEIDSLYILYLTVNPTYAWSERVTFLTFPTTYRERTIPGPGAYEFPYQSSLGCDSIITSYIDQEVYRDEQTVTICPGETHIWSYDGETYTVSGKYTKVEKDAAGNDSVIHVLNLTVRYIPETLIEHTMCKGQTYVFADQSLTESGVYRHTYHKTGGCDSVVVLSLNVLSPDTTYLAIQRPEGESYVWDGETIRDPGMYFHYGTNRFGCDSVSILQFTYNQVDTVSAAFTICPNELPYEWNGISANQTNHYSRLVKEANGNYTLYVLDLTVREVVQRDTTFAICEGGTISFNGVTYDEAGHYRTYLTCDTLINVHIIVNQPVVYETHGTITDDHGFTWQYIDHGTPGEQEFTTAGTYEYENPNPVTGCNDIYRLILTKDETSYHFEESLTICEGDEFSWHGLTNLSSVTGTNTYTDAYETRAGKDSIYTLTLTVIPVERMVRTIVFCGETSWNGVTYDHSAVVYDTISLPTGCYRIERINLDKETSFYHKESKELPQGTVLHWHGQNITTDGTYYDYGTTVNGCDSTYEITVTIIPATPQTNQYAEELSTCEGDTIEWRGKDIWRSGVYVDTVYAAGTNIVDSIFTLTFTAWPAPKDTIIQHMYTCSDGAAIRYQGKDYYTDQVVISHLKTIHNCDSIVKVFMHFNTALSLSRTDTITDQQLPYNWTYQIIDTPRDTVLTKSGTYTHTVSSEGGCTNQEELTLVVLKTYLFEMDTTICETSMPLLWRGQYLQHAVGQTKQYEDVLKTINNTDSIYRINLTIDPAPKRVERISICENKDTLINGKSYFDPILYPVGQVFRDTMYKHNGANECDSIIYYEITKTPQRHIIETRILHEGEQFEWHGITISDPVTKTYTIEDEIDPNTGCEMIYQLRVIAEHRTTDTICVLDTPYVWSWNNEKYYISGLFTDTVFDNDGKIAEYHTLQLVVTDVPHTTIQLYLCDGDKETLPNGKTYHNLVPDSIYRDTIVIMSPTAGCDSTIYYEILQHPIRTTIKNEILRLGDTIFWMGDTITQPITKTYTKDSIDEVTGCKVINQLRVVAEHRDIATICVLDTPFVWSYNNQNYYTSGLFSDTVRDAENFITEYHTLDLKVKIPVDTLRVLRGCKPNGVTWNGVTYLTDTVFRDTLLTCDTLYTIKIQLDTTYNILRFDTICEHNLPYVVGQGERLDSAYREGWLPPFEYKTACGCDSIVQVHLTIIPDFDMDHSDSIFVCEESMPMYIGDTVHPAFDPYRQKVEEWKDKWIGVKISKDTVIYNCGKVDSLHIIMRPHQPLIPEYEYSLCKGDSVQLFWPHKDTWIKEPGDYMDTVPTISSWVDVTHHTLIHNDRAFACDSIVKWKVRYTDTLHVHLYEHIRQGDTYRFNDSILTTTGTYDSIGYYVDIIDPLDPSVPPVSSMDSSHHYCKAIYTLHLTVDPVYRYGDTIEICHPAKLEYTYTFDDDLDEHYAFKFQTPEKDTAIIHLTDSTKHLSYEFYDHFYDLVVYYKQLYHTQIVDTLCYGDSIQFDRHFFEGENNRTEERYLHNAGIYYDTLTALNGCDSIIELRLFVRDRIIIAPQSITVTDRELPYLWMNTWREPGASKDTTHTDSLFVSGEYTYTMPNKFGCDSTVTLSFTVHQTHVFRDTLDICEPINTTFTHEWTTGYKQQYTTPLKDDTVHYYDTLVTFYPLDSIYDLYVNFHRTYETHVYDTICAGDSAQIDTYNAYSLPKRFYKETGIYRDTIPTVNGCDSVIVLHLQVWPGFPTSYKRADIADVDTPYLWVHTWKENGQIVRDTDSLYIAGEYSRRLPNIHGCDSIDSLSLFIHQTYNILLDTITICHDQVPYTWEDKNEIRESDFYTFKTQTHDGYDSIRTVYIEVLPIMHTTLNASICEGDSMRFGLKKDGSPLFLYKDSVYFDTLTSVLHGCDSIIEMRLNVFPRELNKYEQHIADVDTPFIWEHKQAGVIISRDSLYIAGKYEHIFQSQLGCDSIDSLTLYIHQTYRIPDDTINICEHDVPYTWRGLNNITATGDYEYGEQTVDGYDSVHYVHVNVWKQTYDTIYATICEGDSIRWGMDKTTLQPRFVHTAGLHNDTTINSHGCDQVNVLNLTVHPRYYNELTVHIADIDTPYVWKHFNHNGDSIGVDSLYATDKYGFRFETPYVCDSIDSLNLFVHNTYKFTEEFTICERQTPYTWQNRNDITESGTYIYNPRTHDGYDSIYIATITVMPTAHEIITEKICKNNLPFNFHGTELWEGGIYLDTLASMQSGCDSIVELHLTVNDPYYHFERHDIYEGETYTFFGQPCTTGGTYTHSNTTPDGCDSITEILLVVHPMIDTIAYVCSYDLPFAWVNHWTGDTTYLHAAGLYHDKTVVNEEPLFWSIQLNVIEPIQDTIHAAICEGTSYPFIGLDLTKPGTYRDTTQGSNGCDSITTLILTVNQPYYSVIRETILEGQTYVFYGDTFNTTGTYTHYARTPEGCDSTTLLQLSVHPLTDTIITVCDNDLPVIWNNRWSGKQELFYSAGLYRNDTTINSEKRFYGIQVNVLNQVFDTIRHAMCEGASYEFKGNTYYEAGIYRDTLRADNGCDKIVTLILTVNKPYYNVIRETILEGQTYVFYGDTFNTTGTYTHYARTPEGCDSTTLLQLSVHPLTDTIITVCDNDLPVIWNNRWSGKQELFYSAGLYRNDTTINSEKRFYGIQVNVLNQVFDTIRHAMCEGASYEFKGNTYYEAGIYRDTLRAGNGCDSIVTLILTENKPYYNIIRESILEGQYYVFFGDTIRETKTVSHSGRTPEGCDSTTVLELTVHQLVDTVVTVCSSELPYIWRNHWSGIEETFYGAGTYRNDTTINKEHLYYGVKLVVTEPSSATIYREICEGDKYNFNNRLLEYAGEYRDTIRNTSGCDSIIILHLNVLRKYYHTVSYSIYEGDSVFFQGQYFKETGAYPFRFTSSFGCDSVVELLLTVNRIFEDSVSICSNELPYLWHGKTILESGVYRDTILNSDGKEAVVGVKVNVLPIARASEPINVTICEGDYYKFGRNILTEQGSYYDTLTAANGCDSIVMLALRVIPVKYQTTTKRIFEGDSALFNGVWYKESGVYEYREINEFGCFDTYQLILTVLRTFNVDTTAVICDSDLPFIWRGYEYNESGDYSLPISWTDSSRVVKTLHLTVHKSFYAERNISLCSGDEYRFKDSIYTKSGYFFDTIPSPNGCDSIIKYIISVHPTSDKTYEKHISDKEPYIFHDRVLTISGTYEWTGKTVHGCDSMEHLILTVHPSYFRSDTVDLCQSDSLNFPYKWKDENDSLILEISQSGTYTDSILTMYGFDSVRQVVVNVHPSYLINEQYEIGEGEILKIHGRDISSPAVYYDTMRTVYGCDSIYHIVVNKKRTREFTWTKSICQGETFDFFGRQLTKTGQYKYTSQYKDSVVTLTLTVNPVTYSEKRVVITDKTTSYTGADGNTYYTYIHDGVLYDSLRLGNNLFNEQYVNQYGCDSIARLIIFVSSRYSDWTPMPLCPGSEIKIDGDTIRQAGLYTFLRRSKVTGEMDSIWRVEVYDAPAYEFEDTLSLCEGDTVFYGNIPITHGGKQDIKLKTQDGCDSIYHLNVTVYPSYQFDTTVTIFDYESFTWELNHQNYTTEGTYSKTFPTKQDPYHTCDSTYILNLKVIPTSRYSMEYTICDGQEYTWRGKTYSVEGFYYDTVANLATFVSSIYSLHLMVSHPTYIKSAKTTPICADDLTYSIEFEYNGAKPALYSIYYDQRAKDEGFKDVINKPFLGEDKIATDSMPVKTDVIYLQHTNYVKPNKYYMSLVLDNGVCGQSRAENIELTVKYPSWIIEQCWNDVVVPLKKELNGGYEFSQADWIVNGVRQPNNGRGYLEYNFRDGDEVVMIATRKGENYAIETCPLVISLNPTLSYDDPILIYPTQAPKQMPHIHIESPMEGSFEVYGSTGTLLFSGHFDEGDTQVTLPAINGIYFIRTSVGNDTETHKVIIY